MTTHYVTKKNDSSSPSSEPCVDNIWKAAAFGQVEIVKRFLDEDVTLACKVDEKGFYPLQWAALNNCNNVTQCLLNNNAVVNAVDLNGQTALHWAAVRGSIGCAEILLNGGAQLKIKDIKGYTVVHVACQYGHTEFLYNLAMRWGFEVNDVDVDGRSGLHWAAYKGFANTIRLLILLEANVDAEDRDGCLPLHWAAIRGNGEACTLLVQGMSGVYLQKKEITGCTAAELAEEKGHFHLAKYIKDCSLREDRKKGLFGELGKLSFTTSKQLCPIIWMMIIALVTIFKYKVAYHPSLPPLVPLIKFCSWSTIILAGSGLVFLYNVTIKDPGFLPIRCSISQNHKNSYYDCPTLWSGNWTQICVSCKIVRPLRAKHCSITGRCIEEFDHYCPWIGNAVGLKNRFLFFIFLLDMTLAMAFSMIVAISRMHQISQRHLWVEAESLPWIMVFIISDSLVLIGTSMLLLTQASQITHNITTNELANWTRYKHLKALDGSFYNPFNKGWVSNCFHVACYSLETIPKL